jgi:sporulation protein YlmC with PRC-barrel domain
LTPAFRTVVKEFFLLRSLADLKNYRIAAIDGTVGTVHDLLFDDHAWQVRYFVVDTGTWLPGRKVLISPTVARRTAWQSRHIRVTLTRDQVREAPQIDADPPVSRQQERELIEYYAWPAYWDMTSPLPPVPGDSDGHERSPAPARDEPQLRSLREVTGYSVWSDGDHVGHVQDFLARGHNWIIRYLVVDTRKWLPGKRVLLSPNWVNNVDWNAAQVDVAVTQDQMEMAPGYDPAAPVDREHEQQLHADFNRPVYWGQDTESPANPRR